MKSLYTLALSEVWGYFLVAGRLCGLMVFFPGLSSHAISYRTRFLFIMVLTIFLTPVIYTSLLPLPPHSWSISMAFLGEFIIGLFASLLLKTFFSALDVAGTTLGFQMSLSNVFVNSADDSQQEGLLSTFLNLLAVMIMFSTHLHMVILRLFKETYHTFTFAEKATFLNDYSHLFLQTLSAAFAFGIALAGPLMVISVLVYSVAGLMNRLIPQMQVFFLIQPLQLLVGFGLLLLSLPVMIDLFYEKFVALLHLEDFQVENSL